MKSDSEALGSLPRSEFDLLAHSFAPSQPKRGLTRDSVSSTLLVMQRATYNAVTMPVLIPCDKGEAKGRVNLLRIESSPGGSAKEIRRDIPVRPLRDEELTGEWLKKGGGHWVTDLVALYQAIEAQDSLAEKKAAKGNPNFQQLIHQVREAARGDPEFPQRRLSQLLSWQLDSVRLVLWWTGKRFLPALYCAGGIVDAALVRTLLSIVGAKGLRVCPHCSKPFLQTRPDQDYCCVAHREAHRVARWRANKKSRKRR